MAPAFSAPVNGGGVDDHRDATTDDVVERLRGAARTLYQGILRRTASLMGQLRVKGAVRMGRIFPTM